MTNKLLIISSYNISSWITKGEIIERYYNPGNIFKEIHLLLLNNDQPNIKLAQGLFGNAKVYVYNLPEPSGFVKKSLGWQPILMQFWAKKAVKIAETIQPSIVRCQGINLDTYVGTVIKRELSIPFITSLHGNPDVDYYRGRLAKNWKERMLGSLMGRLEKYCLKYIDHIVAVYTPIIPYLKKNKFKNYSVIHNVVAINALCKKNNNLEKQNVKLLCVGRQTHLQKNPENIIRAIADMENTTLTLIGDGELHEPLQELAKKLGCQDRVKFYRQMMNSKILKLMTESDLYVYHSINYEISKGCIEAALIGLPVILNNRFKNPAQELLDAGFLLVEDTPEAYAAAISELILNKKKREGIAKSAHSYALQNWSPEITEKKLVDLYKRYLPQ